MKSWKGEAAKPIVSIKCMSYNHEKYIEDALEGFLIQETDFPFEILIHDDASTDRTADIIREYEARYPNLIKPIYQTENQFQKKDGTIGRIQRDRTKGKYSALCEGDDYWTDPHKLQKQVDFLEANPDYVISFHNTVVEFDNPNKEGLLYSDFPWNGIDRNRDVYTMSDLISSPLCPTVSIVCKRPENLNIPDWYFKVPSRDMALVMLICGDKKIKYFDENWAVYRKHSGGITVNHKGDYIHAGRIFMYLRILEHFNGKYGDDIKKMLIHHLDNINNLSSIEKNDRLKLFNLIPEYFADKKAQIEVNHKAPLKVTFVAYGPNQINGPNIWLQRILPELAARGIKPEVIFLMNADSECTVLRNLQRNGIPCIVVPRQQYTEQNILQLLNILKPDPPDLFVPNLSVPAYFASRWIKEAGIPTVGILHSDDNFHHELIEYFVSGDMDYRLSGIVCVSEYIKGLVEAQNVPDVEMLKCPYGISLPDKTVDKPGRELNLVYTGRLIQRQKRIFDVIESLKKVLDKIPGTSATLYGEDREQGNAIEAINTAQFGNRLRYGGLLAVDEIFPALLQNHVFVLLSDYEGMSISLMEAMGCGLVPVCTKTKSGATEIIKHDENGLLVDNREEDFLNTIVRLQNEKGLWRRLSKAARKTVEKEYTIKVCADRWADFIKKMVLRTSIKSEIKIPASDSMNLPQIKITDNGIAREDKRIPLHKKTSFKNKKKHEYPAALDGISSDWRRIILPEKIKLITTMLSVEERQLLYMLGKEYWKGVGAIIDAGCFLGGSTLSLAMGVSENKINESKFKVIHSYDLFIADKHQSDKYLKKYGDYSPGDSIRSIFDQNTFEIKNILDIHEGDITSFPWDKTAIELLFIDVSKSWEINDFIVREFFPNLIPNHSIIIQQDFIHPTCPWLAITMEFFSEYFEPIIYVPNNSVVFILKKKIPYSKIRHNIISSLSAQEKLSLMDSAINRYEKFLEKGDLVELECARAILKLSLLGVLEAQQSLIEINDKYKNLKRTKVAINWVEKRISENLSNSTRQNNFINIPLTPENMDLYYMRSSIKKSIDEKLNIFKGTLLDLGCGEMPYKQYILSNSKVEKYIGLDIENPTYQQNGKPDMFWDGRKIPLDDNTVDTVMATELFEHLPDIESVLKEINRVLKPGGLLFFTVPFLWPLHDAPHDEYRYTPFSLERHLKAADFTDISINALGGWNASLAQMIGLWVKRSGLNKEQTDFFTKDLFTFYNHLLQSDYTPQAFQDQIMTAGFSGTAFKNQYLSKKAR